MGPIEEARAETIARNATHAVVLTEIRVIQAVGGDCRKEKERQYEKFHIRFLSKSIYTVI